MPLPPRQGLYDPDDEHDACGLGFVATLKREPTHQVVASALEILCNLTHRGAAGCDPYTGDGAGVLLQIPHTLYQAWAQNGLREPLPAPGDYAVATCFFSTDPARRRQHEAILEAAVVHHGQRVLGWRDVPVRAAALGPTARATAPKIRQLFIGRTADKNHFEPLLFLIRKRAGRTAHAEDFYVASCSARTVVYKGLMLAEQLADYFCDLSDPLTTSRLAMVHSRFSTNTFPSWERAHPFRRLAHNGEINTLRGNRTWMAAREALLESELWGEAIEDFRPIIRAGGSDSAALDNVADFLVASGRSLPQVMMMLVPEAWVHDPAMSAEKKAFYEYHGCLVEPWDGPAALCFTDGAQIGATLDRNGLRPAKYVVTSDGLVVLASELGVLSLDPKTVIEKGRLQPGKMFLVDVDEGRIVSDEEIEQQIATQKPYRRWLDANKIDLANLPPADALPTLDANTASALRHAFGYTEEDVRMLLGPMAQAGEEPTGSMGADVALACLSPHPQSLFRYFKQHFAQVTNPPIDPIREELVMSLVSCIGPEGNLLEATPGQCRMIEVPHPILTDDAIARLRQSPFGDFPTATIDMVFPVAGDPEEALREGLHQLTDAAERAVRGGARVIILSDRKVDSAQAPIPSVLATGAVHHALMRAGLRVRCGLLVESAEPREVAHLALLIGFGAGAVNPYLALVTVAELASQGLLGDVTPEVAQERYIKALKKGLLKVMSKMGISTLGSYQGADRSSRPWASIRSSSTSSSPERRRASAAWGWPRLPPTRARGTPGASIRPSRTACPKGGTCTTASGAKHLWTPDTIASLQKAVRLGDAKSYDEYARLVNEQGPHPATLRGLWDRTPVGPAVPIEEVEPAKELVKRFSTGAMSFGSISKEAHENLAIAMNRIGARSNTGEGGEDAERFKDERRSAIKQVASARFGVTANYLVNADELQTEDRAGRQAGGGGAAPRAQGRRRHRARAPLIPGVTLVSPPPHHDIYSIEISPSSSSILKNVNSSARVSVKLVAEAGVDHRRGRGQGARRRHPHQRSRRHGRLAAHVDSPRGPPVGAGPGRGAAGAGHERPSRARAPAGRRAAQDRARRALRGAARRRGASASRRRRSWPRAA